MNNKLWYVCIVALVLSFAIVAIAKQVSAEDNESESNQTDDDTEDSDDNDDNETSGSGSSRNGSDDSLEDESDDNSQDSSDDNLRNDDDSDEERSVREAEDDLEEAQTMFNGIGAQVRLLQLEKSITRNLLIGQNVLEQIDDLNISVNTTAMENILDDLQDVLSEVRKLENTTVTESSVEAFAELKAQSRDLSKQFREEIQNKLTLAQRQAIRSAIPLAEFEEVKDLNDEIRGKIREFNYERAAELLKSMSVTDNELLKAVKSGNITSEELKEELKQAFGNLSPEQKREFAKQHLQLSKLKWDIHEKVVAKWSFLKGWDAQTREKYKSVLNDDSLSEEERMAKLRVLTRETIQEGRQEISQEIRTEWKDRMRERISERTGNSGIRENQGEQT